MAPLDDLPRRKDNNMPEYRTETDSLLGSLGLLTGD